MQFDQALEGFYLARTADGMSPHTILIYRWGLVPLSRALGNPEVEAITTQQLRNYMADLFASGRYSARSLQMVYRCIGAFFTWATPELQLASRPDRAIKKPKGEGEEVQPFSLEEIEKLLKACEFTKVAETQGNRRVFQMRRSTARRDKAIVLFLLDTGLRAGEMCRLNLEDVNLEEGEAAVRPFRASRKSRPRTVYFGARVKRALWAYLALRGKPTPDEPLFLGEQNEQRRFTPNHLGKMIRGLGERSGVRNAHPHRLRHTMAIQYLRNRGDPFTLRQILGLSSWGMVQVYVQLAGSDMRDVHGRSSPVDNWRV